MRRAVWLVVCAGVASASCDRFKKHHDAGADAATASAEDASASSAQADAARPASLAANERDIRRFDDEEKLEHDEYTVEWPAVDAKSEPATGLPVAKLAKGTKVTFQARKGHTILATFADPKDASKTLLGWIPEDAFVPGTAPPPVAVKVSKDGGVSPGTKTTGVCPVGLTLLFGDDAFCGKPCKVDKDCPAGLVCQGQAKPINAQGMGAPVPVCAKPKAVAVTKPDAGAPIGSTPTAKADAAGAAPVASTATTVRPDAGAATAVTVSPGIAPLRTAHH
jgi:hypothetical protein